MAAGDLSIRLPADTDDELGSLAVAFNQMAASLEGQIAALRDGRDRERRFVADVSHELRTPLTALVNEAAHLRGRLDSLPETDRRVGELLVADVARLRVLVEDLLEISRLDSAPTHPEPSRVDLARFLEAVIEARYPAAELQLLGTVSTIAIDRRSLERIVGNLLDNARRHAPDAPVSITAGVESGALTIEVADLGPGVAGDALALLFDRFYKTDQARRGGSGLGLAIARQHARRLGGDLTVAPIDPNGLAFTMTIPVAESLRSSDGDENSVSEPEGEQRHQARRTP
jgi:two-component system sensor histidine kinase MtrB